MEQKLTQTTDSGFYKFIRVLFIILAVLVIMASLLRSFADNPSAAENLYLHQARAFLNGHLDVDQQYHDVAVYEGRFYPPFPPFPAVVLVPFAFLGISSPNIIFITLAMTMLNVIIMARIFSKLAIDPDHIRWLIAAFVLGTGYWLCIRGSQNVWHFAHTVSVTCLLLAINEVFGRNRGILIGMFLGFSFLSRQLTIFAVFFLFIAMLNNPLPASNRKKVINAVAFAFAIAVSLCVYFGINWLRFGNILDTGYSYLPQSGFLELRQKNLGVFHPSYIPFNFIYMFVQGFHIEFKHSYYLWNIRMDPFGTSLTFASPFVFVALRAIFRKRLLVAAWVSISLMIMSMLLYYCNGWSQVNTYRYTLDFMPILMVLVALGTKRVPAYLWKGAIVYSIFLNFLALFFIPFITGQLLPK